MAGMLPRALFGASLMLLATGTSLGLVSSVANAQRAKGSGAPIATGTPESVGMSTARLARLTGAFQKEIANKKLPGVVMMVSRRGRLVYSTALGLRDPKGTGRVGMWRGGFRLNRSVAASFVWRCLNGSAVTPFPHSAHRTRTGGSPTSGSRTRPHAFAHGSSCPSRHKRTSPKCP